MDKIIIKGGEKLKGNVKISGAKNAALPILVSSLLVKGRNIYSNVPDLIDIDSIKKLLVKMGAEIETTGDNVKIDTTGLYSHEAEYDLVRKMRASVLVLGPLCARMKKARVSLPGGCAIGARPINFHLKGLEALGAKIKLEHGYVEVEAPHLTGNDIYFDIPTVTGTENLMMAAVLADGKSVLHNAAQEPEIIALAEVLQQMGAKIENAGSSVITIYGVEELKPANASIIPDRIETGTFMVASALTKGELEITNCRADHMDAVIQKLRSTGAVIEYDNSRIFVKGPEKILSADMKTLPYPGFPTDMQAQFMVLMSVAENQSIITETIFENRFIHVSELKRLGANIKITGNTAVIKGVSYLSGAQVMATDLRASASLILAGLVANGKTEISRVYHLDRGYEKIEEKFSMLGADIKRAKE